MQRLKTTINGALVALFICGAAACGDDNHGNAANPDGSTPVGTGDAAVPHDAGAGMDASPGVLMDGAITTAPDGATGGGGNQDGGTTTLPPGPDGGTTSAGPCGSSCNDNVDCTIDTCVDNKCTHRVNDSVCGAGSSCDLTKGCQQGKTCANAMDCADMDGCTTNERCDTTLARCLHDVLDSDSDGYPPTACGGADCNDARGLTSPGALEACDGMDNNCNSMIDEGATCPGAGQACVAGSCVCTTGLTECGGAGNRGCFDLKITANHCGACGTDCGSGGVCTNGACSCPAPTGTMCTMGMNSSCVDVKTSDADCGGCGMACPLMTNGQFNSCLQGACTPCGAENQACCAPPREGNNNGCLGDLTCSGKPGAAEAKCLCGAGDVQCNGQCTDLRTSYQNCGMCGKSCMGQERCLPQGETSACVACGAVGQRCCDIGFGSGCFGGGTACGPNDTCVRVNVQTPPGN